MYYEIYAWKIVKSFNEDFMETLQSWEEER